MAQIELFSLINERYGPEAKKLLKLYCNLRKQFDNALTSKEFLINCRRHGVIPKHIRNDFKNISLRIGDGSPLADKWNRKVEKFRREILSTTIEEKFRLIGRLLQSLRQNLDKIYEIFPAHLYVMFLNSREEISKRSLAQLRKTHRKKLDGLIRERDSTIDKRFNPSWVCNLTNFTIPATTTSLLSYGPKLALPPRKSDLHWPKIISDVESIVKAIENPEKQNAARMKIVNVLSNFKAHPDVKEDSKTEHIRKCFNDTQKFMKEVVKSDAILTVADKGGKTVLMPRAEYQEQMKTLVDDRDTYKKVNYDPTNRVQTHSNRLVSQLFQKGFITKFEKMQLHRSNSVAPKIYGSQKIHKLSSFDNATREKVKLRPIVSCIDSPLVNISKFVSKILFNSINQQKYNVRNSSELCEELKKIRIPDGYTIVSFDVVSLFTVVPPDLVIKIVDERWSTISNYTNIDKETFMEVMKHILSSSYFQYEGDFYKQLCGSPMGDAASPVQADLVLDHLLDHSMQYFDFVIELLKKYVDDLLMILPKDKIDYVQRVFNGFHPNIKFTVETENENGEIPYLDMMLKHENDGSISTRWYKKPIASGRIINYLSSHPTSMKLNTARNLISRIVTLSSDGFTTENRNLAKSILMENNYPAAICNRLLSNFNRSRAPRTTNTTPPIHRSFSNIPKLLHKIGRIINSSELEHPIKLCPKNILTAKQVYSRLKDPINPNHVSNVIYKLSCSCGKFYIGLTSQYHHCRSKQHKRDHDKILDLRAKGVQDTHPDMIKAMKDCTALAKHVADTNHQFDFKNVEIVDKGNNRLELKMLEMIHIKQNSNSTVNYKTDVENLSDIYNCLF